jgi:hypothetical protein
MRNPDAAAAAAVVARMAAVVEATAAFMAAYPSPPLPGHRAAEEGNETLWLGPPTDGAEEGNPSISTWNPTFELTYWRLALQIAQQWRMRSGRPPKAAWAAVLKNLAHPTVLPAPLNSTHGPRTYAINANCWGFPRAANETKGWKAQVQWRIYVPSDAPGRVRHGERTRGSGFAN